MSEAVLYVRWFYTYCRFFLLNIYESMRHGKFERYLEFTMQSSHQTFFILWRRIRKSLINLLKWVYSTSSTRSHGGRKEYPPAIINKVTVVRVNDYTKNISQSIFTPGLSKHTKVPTSHNKYESPVKTINRDRL